MQPKTEQMLDDWRTQWPPDDSVELVGYLLTQSDRLREALAKPDIPDELRGGASTFADYLDKRARDMLTDAGITPERVSALFARPEPTAPHKQVQA